MNFKTWLEGLEEYEPYRARVEATPRRFAFSRLFAGADENGRVFIPFSSEDMSEEDRKSLKYLEEALAEGGYEVADLKGGYARMKGRPNLVKIGKLLDTLKYKDHKKNDAALSAGSVSRLRHESERRTIDKYYDDIKSDFENMAYRAGSEFEVAISMNAHDIASMSTGRGWSSCMNLKEGGHKRDVYCEVGYGGFIAYLVRKGDREIKRPIARIHVRRFDSKSGRSVAVPEETVYGTDKEGFLEAVRAWLDRTQGVVEAGPYRRMGGAYSDTFGGDKKHFVRPDPKDTEKVMSWVDKWMKMKRDKKARYWHYFAHAMSSLVAPSGASYPREFLVRVRDYIFGKRKEAEAEFGTEVFEGGALPVKNGFNQNCNQYVPSFAIRFPEVITRDHFVHAFTYAANHRQQSDLLDRLAEAFPQYADKDMLKAARDSRVREKIVGKVKGLDAHHLAVLEDEFKDAMKLDNPRFRMSEVPEGGRPVAGGITSPYEIQHNITTEMDKLAHFRPIPERLVRQLVGFVGGLGELNLEPRLEGMPEEAVRYHRSQASQARSAVLRHAIHVLGLSGTDTPSVQEFYRGLLPRWEESGGIGRLGWGLARLGENGRSFIPFLKEKRKEVEGVEYNSEMKNLRIPMDEARFEKSKEETLEAFDHVIDTLEGGRTSQKYKMEYGDMLDAYLHDQVVRDGSHELRKKIFGWKR
jgi:hypothetical protein